jgi:hypothetical protein
MKKALVMLLIAQVTLWAASSSIGMVTSTGSFHLENSRIWNNATLLEGSTIQTGKAMSQLHLKNGSRITLSANSAGRVFEEKLVLRGGASEALLTNGYSVEAENLKLRVAGDDSTARLQVKQNGNLLVAALGGPLTVHNARGVLIANLSAGNALELSAAQGGASTASTLTGIIKKGDPHFLLTDEATNVTVELRGDNVAKFSGKRVTIRGSIDYAKQPINNASYVLQVNSVNLAAASGASGLAGGGAAAAGAAGPGGPVGGIPAAGTGAGAVDVPGATAGAATAPADAAAGAAGAATAGAGAGAGAGATAAIVGGVVAAAAATTGIVVAGGDEEQDTVSP